MWSTSMVIYRRTATTTASRLSEDILRAAELGQPEVQYMHPSDFFTIYDSVFINPLNGSGDACLTVRPEYLQTIMFYTYLNESATRIRQTNSQPLDYLRNVLATPLYLCNAVTLTASKSPHAPQSGLGEEYYTNGSAAFAQQRAVPARWTVWTYAATAGMLLLLTFVVALISCFASLESSSFPLVDFLTLPEPVRAVGEDEWGDTMARAQAMRVEEIFPAWRHWDNSGIVQRSSEIRLRARNGA
jgi:hypothetical protein